jgi:protein SCO1/2
MVHGWKSPATCLSFSLLSTQNQVFNNQSLRGKWTIAFFGFTSCGYLCPTTLAELTKMYKKLEQMKVKNLPQVVFITVDPEKDTMPVLSNYITAFNPQFLGLRGTEEYVKHLANETGITYIQIANPKDTSEYTMEHSGTLIVFNPEGKIQAFFSTPHNGAVIAQDYLKLISST